MVGQQHLRARSIASATVIAIGVDGEQHVLDRSRSGSPHVSPMPVSQLSASVSG